MGSPIVAPTLPDHIVVDTENLSYSINVRFNKRGRAKRSSSMTRHHEQWLRILNLVVADILAGYIATHNQYSEGLIGKRLDR